MDALRKLSVRYRYVIAGILAGTVSLTLWWTSLLAPVEDALSSMRADLLSRPASGEVVVVEIDSRSIHRYGEWPWPRSRHAELVERLTEAEASIIGFDIDFSARSHAGDEAFAEAIAKSGRVVLPIFYQRASGRGDEREAIVNRPLPMFDAWVGAVNIYPDADGIVRDYPAATHLEGQIQPSLATVVAENSEWGDRIFHPDWAIDPQSLPQYSFAQIVDGTIDPSLLKGKRIFVGGTAIELGDRYAVPRHGVIPGVLVQALAADSLVQGRAIVSTGAAATIAGIVLIILVFAPRRRTRTGILAVKALVALAMLLGVPVLVQSQWPIAIQSASWLVALTLCVSLQLAVHIRDEIEHRARTDPYSGLPNRKALEETLSDEPDCQVLVAASIERFEKIRNNLGLKASSEALIEVAQRISDVTETQVFRIAPDVIAWSEDMDVFALTGRRLQELQHRFREPVGSCNGPTDIQLVFGFDSGRRTDAPVLRIERALSAIASARESGQQASGYAGENRSARRQMTMMSDLRLAMAEGRVSVVYQPKLLTRTKRLDSAEALIRWRNRDGKMVPPDEFIPLAEQTGAITEVTLYAFRRVLDDLAEWDRSGVEMSASINISAVDLGHEGFASLLGSALGNGRISPARLTLEITESALIRSATTVTENLEALRALGFRLSIDDYGTGQSTLSYLQQLPVDELKIDKSFIQAIEEKSSSVLVKSTIDMAHGLELEVVAEGVEDARTLSLLSRWGCDYVQGHHIGKPMPPEALARLVVDQRKTNAA